MRRAALLFAVVLLATLGGARVRDDAAALGRLLRGGTPALVQCHPAEQSASNKKLNPTFVDAAKKLRKEGFAIGALDCDAPLPSGARCALFAGCAGCAGCAAVLLC